jgi:diaminopimelate epimerase
VRGGGESTVLHGPAVLVAQGELDRTWWETAGARAGNVGHSGAR